MSNNNGFLPENYTAPQAAGGYMKLKDGDNRFRILSRPIIGWEDWIDKKPVRYPMSEKPTKPHDPTKPIKHFWAMVVWNCTEEKVQILEITQSTIQGAIQNLSKDEDWGNPMEYDIKVKRTGDGMETKYTVNPAPKAKISKEIQEALVAKGDINLMALFTGDDPFSTKLEKTTSDLPF